MFRYWVLKFRGRVSDHAVQRPWKVWIAIALLLPLLACGQKQSDPSDPTETPLGQNTPTEQPSESPAPTNPTEAPTSTETPGTGTSVSEELGKLQVYWLTPKETALGLKGSPLTLAQSDQPLEAQVKAAMERLIEGPANADVASAIPQDTQVNRVEVKDDGIHVDLSKPFMTGGGSASMQGRLGQVIYTASSLDPKMPVWISIDGEALTVLAGEGLEVTQPMTRKVFQESFTL